MVLIAWFGFSTGSASILRTFVTDGGPSLLPPRAAVVTTVGSLLILCCAVAARARRAVGPVEHDGNPAPDVTHPPRRLVGFSALPLLLLVPLGVVLLMNGRYDADGAVMPMIAAALLPFCLPVIGRARLATVTTVGWLVLACTLFWVPPPWPELCFAALAVLGWGEIVRWGYSLGRARGQRRGSTVTAVHLAFLALLSVMLMLAVPVGPSAHDTPRTPPRVVVLPYLAPSWTPAVETEEQWWDRALMSYKLSRGSGGHEVTRVWAASVASDGPTSRRYALSARVEVSVADRPITVAAVRNLLEDEATYALDPVSVSALGGLPLGWDGAIVETARSRRAVAIGRADNVVVVVPVGTSTSYGDDAGGEARDLARRIAARGIVAFAADTDPLR